MKSIEIKFAEAMDAVRKAGRTKQFDENSKSCTTIESKLNAAEATLKDVGVTRANESGPISRLTHEQYQLFSKRIGKKPGMSLEEQTTLAEGILSGVIKESTPKHNGPIDNLSESNPLRELFSPGYVKENKTTNPLHKGDKVMFDGLLKLGKITEAEHKKLTGNKPEGYEKLTEQKRKDWDFARAVGLSESDAFKLVEMTDSTFKESRR